MSKGWPLQITIPLPYEKPRGHYRDSVRTYGCNTKIVLTEQERNEVNKAAERCGLSYSMFCRSVVHEAAMAVNGLIIGEDDGTRCETESSDRKMYE